MKKTLISLLVASSVALGAGQGENVNKKVLIALTNVSQYGADKRATGVWLEEAATPYAVLKAAGFEVDFASSKGGAVPVDPHSPPA